MLLFFARSGSRHPVLPVALGLVIGGSVSNLVDRVRLGHVTDFLDVRVLAGVQPRGQLHRRRRRASCCSRSSPQIALRVRVPDDAAGARLDAFVATHVGSRAAAERAIDAGMQRRRRRAREVVAAGGRGGGRVRGACAAAATSARGTRASTRVRGRAPARRRQARGPGRPSCGRTRDRHARPRARRRSRGRGGGAAGHRAPARPRDLGADGRREDGAGVRAAAVARPRPQTRAGVPRARAREAAVAAWTHRGSRSGAIGTIRCGTRSTRTPRATR